MTKKFIKNLPYIFLHPRKYFLHSIVDNEFSSRDLIILDGGLIVIISLLHILSLPQFPNHQLWIEEIVYLGGFTVGLALSVVFRTYFLTTVLNKIGIETDHKKIGMIVGIAMIPIAILFLVLAILKTPQIVLYVKILFISWNLVLVLIGILTLSKIRFRRGLFLVLLMLGIEMMFVAIMGGIQL